MKQEEVLKVGEKIELEVSEGENPSQYLSKVEEIIDDNTFVITRPLNNEEYTYLSMGQVIRVMYFRKEALYYFDAEVIERIKSEENVSAKISIISDKYKLQRRDYYRLSIMVPVTVIAKVKTQSGMQKAQIKYDTMDISGGGLKIATSYQPEENDELKMFVNISGIEHEEIEGKVVRSQPSLKDLSLFETAVEFTKIESNVRQVIIRYIFAKQRELIKKGFK